MSFAWLGCKCFALSNANIFFYANKASSSFSFFHTDIYDTSYRRVLYIQGRCKQDRASELIYSEGRAEPVQPLGAWEHWQLHLAEFALS